MSKCTAAAMLVNIGTSSLSYIRIANNEAARLFETCKIINNGQRGLVICDGNSAAEFEVKVIEVKV